MQVQRVSVAAQAALEAAGVHGTLLKKGRGEAACGEEKGADHIVSEDDCGAGEVESGRIQRARSRCRP
jgi:hypothetical protein